MEDIIVKLEQLIEEGDLEGAVEEAKLCLSRGVEPVDFFQNSLVPVMDRIGNKFARMQIFLPDLIFAADVAKAIKDELQQIIENTAEVAPKIGKIIIGSVYGDVHDIGKNMVSTLLEVNGFEVIDLGTSVEVMDFINSAQRENADIIAMSSLLTTSMPYMAEVVRTLEGLGLRKKYKVVVGGGPVSEEYALSIGADAYGNDAREAIEVCRMLVKGAVNSEKPCEIA